LCASSLDVGRLHGIKDGVSNCPALGFRPCVFCLCYTFLLVNDGKFYFLRQFQSKTYYDCIAYFLSLGTFSIYLTFSFFFFSFCIGAGTLQDSGLPWNLLIDLFWPSSYSNLTNTNYCVYVLSVAGRLGSTINVERIYGIHLPFKPKVICLLTSS